MEHSRKKSPKLFLPLSHSEIATNKIISNLLPFSDTQKQLPRLAALVCLMVGQALCSYPLALFCHLLFSLVIGKFEKNYVSTPCPQMIKMLGMSFQVAQNVSAGFCSQSSDF